MWTNRRLLLLAILISVFLSPALLPSDKPSVEPILRYLETKYDGFSKKTSGEYLIADLSFIREWADLKSLEMEALRVYLPKTQFYLTTIFTPQHESTEVATVVAATSLGTDRPAIVASLSPLFDSPSPKFLALFYGLTAHSVLDREDLVRAITHLFAAVTYEGSVGAVAASGDMATGELWHGDQHWRNINLVFGEDAEVVAVSVENPRSRP